MSIPLQSGIIYGPINSRRLGCSLGINILPTTMKICTFNCLYCQYGWTDIHSTKLEDESLLPSPDEVAMELEKALRRISPPPAYITFSGNGEPTLHPNFNEIVDSVISLRDQFSANSKTAIISNSTLMNESSIRKAVSKLDVKIMKFECGNEAVFRAYNHPCHEIKLTDVATALQSMEDVTIQALFSGGAAGNYNVDHVVQWIEKIKAISPLHVQLYTLDRSGPANNIQALEREDLLSIKKLLERENISVEVY